MTFYLIAKPLLDEQERVRKERGEEAANECAHGQIGSLIKSTQGALTGAAACSIVPGVGTAVGFVVGGLFGAIFGGEDKTEMDNLKSAAKASGAISRLGR